MVVMCVRWCVDWQLLHVAFRRTFCLYASVQEHSQDVYVVHKGVEL